MPLLDMRSALFGTYRPISAGYLTNLSADIFKFTAIVLVTIEAVYLSNVILSRVLAELLALNAGARSIALVVLYSIPNGLFIALPTALLIAVYIVVLRRRENQEFKIFAGFGYSVRALYVTAVTIGFAGAMLSLALSGFVEPAAKFRLATTLEGVAHQAIRDGELKSGRFYEVDDTTLFAASGDFSDGAGDVFLLQNGPHNVSKVIVASKLVKPRLREQDGFGLLLSDVSIYEFSDRLGPLTADRSWKSSSGCETCDRPPQSPPLRYMHVEQFYMGLPEVSATLKRDWRHPREANFIELFSAANWEAEHVEVLGERMLRAILCLITPLLALVAVALTSKSTLLFSLPITSALVLLLSFFASNNIGLISQFGIGVMATALLGGATVFAGVLIILVEKLNSYFIRAIGVSL